MSNINTRTATWSNIGYNIDKATTVEEALHLAHLDYEVEKVPVFLESGLPVKGAYATQKAGTNEVFGVVGKGFEIIQNVEALDFVNALLNQGMKFVRAGETSRVIYLIGQLPDIEVLGDVVTPHVIFQNSHNGSSTLKATIAPLRIVCQNQFNITFRNVSNQINIRHTKSIKEKLHTAQEILISSTDYLTEFQKTAALLASKKVTPGDVDSWMDQVLEVKPGAITPKQEEKKEALMAAYKADDNANFVGTQWGLINAYSDFITHRPLRKEDSTALANRFVKTTLKRGFNDVLRVTSRPS